MDSNYFIGVDIGGTSAKIGLVRNDGTMLEKEKVKTDSTQKWKKIVNSYLEPIKNWIDKGYKIKGIGIGIPGFFDNNENVIKNCENISSLINAPVVEYIKKTTKIPVFIDNDATVAAVGEHTFGAGTEFDNFLMVTIGTGIGGGLILNNQVYRGSCGYAGELGHIIVVAEGRECTCGNRGCIEAYASATSIIKRINDGIKKGFITSYGKNEKINAHLIFEKAHNGDPYSVEAIDSAARYLGRVLGGIVNLLNLDAIIIGGGVSLSGMYFIDKIKYYCNQVAWNFLIKDLQILPAKLQNNAGIIGAASLAIHELEKNVGC